MREIDIKHQIFKVSDFLSWQREGSLLLSPSFQRRPVWQTAAKSYLIDTIVRGLPVPVIFVRERLNLDTQRTIREVVDGQQRLRTLFTYVDPASLSDFNPTADPFEVSSRHNREIAGKPFAKLDDDVKRRILGYEFSTHVLPSMTEDRDVLMIFARLNSTGTQLNGQELRNAEFFGPFKASMYELALEQLERWRKWAILSEEQIARMQEVELTSDLVMTIIERRVTGKTQKRLNSMYKNYDGQFPDEKVVGNRFRRAMDTIDAALGEELRRTVFSGEVFFYSLFVLVYDKLYGLTTSTDRERPGKRIDAHRLRNVVFAASSNFRSNDIPDDVFDAVVRASSDTGRRQTRHDYLNKLWDAESSS